jgi:cytochrome c oxidase subunit II
LLGPETAHSPNAEDLNALYWVLLIIAGAVVVLINVALIAFAMRFRAGRGREPRRIRSRRPAQFLIGGILAFVAVAIFVVGVLVTDDASQVEASGPEGLQASSARLAQRDLQLPTDPKAAPTLDILASGQQWIWRYQYPDGTYSYYELVVPVDTAVRVHLISTDVVHRWWVPSLGGKFDAVPGESNWTWFKADKEGTYYGTAYQFSGASYATMRTQVEVVSADEYQAWLEQQKSDIQSAQSYVQEELARRGEPGTESGSGPVEPPGQAGGEAQK